MTNVALNPDQSGTKAGNIQATLAETVVRSRLVVLYNNAGVLTARYPDAVTDLALYIADESGDSGDVISLTPLSPDSNVRLRLNSTVASGARVILCDPAASSGANAGKVETQTATAGRYFSPGIAEENGVDEQLTLIRPDPQIITVATEVTDGTTNGVAAAAADLAALKAETELIGDTLRELLAALVVNGQITLA